MPTKLFITGLTGYIGGDAFYYLSQHHPNFEYSALIRSEEKAKRVREAYPNVRTVIGSLDDSEVLAREAAWADIVLRMLPAPSCFLSLYYSLCISTSLSILTK